jgi:hypothetical protein
MSLFQEPPPAITPDRHQVDEAAATGCLGGPSYRYRGAVIDCLKGGYVCRLTMETHPLHGLSFGAVGTITPLVDGWIDESRLPCYMRAVPKA